MEKILKYSQLAKALNIGNASVSMAVRNKTLVPEENSKRINIEYPMNKIWIENQISKGKTFDINRVFNPQKEIVEKSKDVIVEEIEKKPSQVKKKIITVDDIRKLELKKKIADLKRVESLTKLNELRIEKQEGKLIPFVEAEFLLSYIVEKIRNTSIQEVDSMSNIYKERFSISHSEYIELKKDLNDIINGIIKDSVSEMRSGMKGIQEKYQEVRGKGERVN